MQIDMINKQLKMLHDSQLIAIADDLKANTSKLTFVLENEETTISIYLKDVISSRSMNWTFGNIVLDASIVMHSQRIIDLLIFADELSDIQVNNKVYIDTLKKIHNSELLVFELNPSYGAYYVSVCKSIEIIS
jgi:hypothetical protein